MNHILRLDNILQNYAWGSRRFIPELLGQASPTPRQAGVAAKEQESRRYFGMGRIILGMM